MGWCVLDSLLCPTHTTGSLSDVIADNNLTLLHVVCKPA